MYHVRNGETQQLFVFLHEEILFLLLRLLHLCSLLVFLLIMSLLGPFFHFSFCSVSKLCVSVRRTVENRREAAVGSQRKHRDESFFFLSAPIKQNPQFTFSRSSCDVLRDGASAVLTHQCFSSRFIRGIKKKQKTLAHKNPSSYS